LIALSLDPVLPFLAQSCLQRVAALFCHLEKACSKLRVRTRIEGVVTGPATADDDVRAVQRFLPW